MQKTSVNLTPSAQAALEHLKRRPEPVNVSYEVSLAIVQLALRRGWKPKGRRT